MIQSSTRSGFVTPDRHHTEWVAINAPYFHLENLKFMARDSTHDNRASCNNFKFIVFKPKKRYLVALVMINVFIFPKHTDAL